MHGQTGRVTEKTGSPVAKVISLVAGPVVFAATVVAPMPADMPETAVAVLALVLWMVVWWVTQAVPIAVTSLLPVVVVPLSGVAGMAEAAAPYADPVIFLMLGGFIIATAIEKHGLHRRIAFGIVGVVGVSPTRLLLGLMASTAFLSMWISNTATVLIMVPLVLAVVSQLRTEVTGRGGLQLAPALLLGVAYAGSTGGMATLVGSPPNAIFAGVAESSLGREIGFSEWFFFAVPLTIILSAAAFGILAVMMRRARVSLTESAVQSVHAERRALAPMSQAERRVLTVFVLVALAWVARPFLLEPVLPRLTDAMIAIAGALLLFVVPERLREKSALLVWDDMKNVSWHILILMGGGLSLAAAFRAGGLDEWIGAQLGALEGLPLPLITLVVATVVVAFTNFASNTAVATLIMPIAIVISNAIGVSPLSMMATAAVSASSAFVMPVGTPPNAIVFSSGHVTVGQMARAGLILSVVAIPLVTLVSVYWMPMVLN